MGYWRKGIAYIPAVKYDKAFALSLGPLDFMELRLVFVPKDPSHGMQTFCDMIRYVFSDTLANAIKTIVNYFFDQDTTKSGGKKFSETASKAWDKTLEYIPETPETISNIYEATKA